MRQGKSVGSGGIAEDVQCHGQHGAGRLGNGENKEARKNLDSSPNCAALVPTKYFHCQISLQIKILNKCVKYNLVFSQYDTKTPSRQQCISIDHAVIIACIIEKSCTILNTAL